MRGFVGAVMAVGLLVGCGGVEAEAVAEEGRETTQFRACSDEHQINYYADAAYTQLIGIETCECWELPVRSGSTSTYRRVLYRYAC